MRPHKEHSMRIRIATIVLIAISAALPAAAQTADEVVAKTLEARGGAAKLKAVQAQRISGRIAFGPEAEGPFVVEFKHPGKYHMDLEMLGKKISRNFDGKSAGWTFNPFAGETEPRAMTPEELKNVTEESDFDGPFIDYKAKGNQVELAGKEKVEDKDAWRLRITMKSGTVRFYLVDASTYLPAKWEGKGKDRDGNEILIESYYHDYHDVDGFKFAWEILTSDSGKTWSQKITVEKVEIDPKLEDADFAKPPAPPAAPPAAPKP
jgi:hypothetical protein